jgi:hypothetical protein
MFKQALGVEERFEEILKEEINILKPATILHVP